MNLIHPCDEMVLKSSVNLWDSTAGISAEVKMFDGVLLPPSQMGAFREDWLNHLGGSLILVSSVISVPDDIFKE